MKKIVLALVLITGVINAQLTNKSKLIKDIPIKIQVYLDNKMVETSNVIIKSGPCKISDKVTNDFTTWLEVDKEYKFTITHPGYNEKHFKIIPTSSKNPLECIINLDKDKPDQDIGCIKYNKFLNKYIFYN